MLKVHSKDGKTLEVKLQDFKEFQELLDHTRMLFEYSDSDFLVTDKFGQAEIGIVLSDLKVLSKHAHFRKLCFSGLLEDGPLV